LKEPTSRRTPKFAIQIFGSPVQKIFFATDNQRGAGFISGDKSRSFFPGCDFEFDGNSMSNMETAV